jgi:formylglycine-generating enzyme required for sulfatase activity
LPAPAGAGAEAAPDPLVFVAGGSSTNIRSNFCGPDVTVADFYIGRYEVTQKEWTEVMGDNPSQFQGDDRPVEMVSWYDCIEYCNRRSLREGLEPYYTIARDEPDPQNGSELDDLKWTVTINPGAKGYRLPTEAEWEYAAGGGQKSEGLTYSGSDHIDAVAWFWQNSGDEPLSGLWNWPLLENNHNRTHPVGAKEPNELGLYDMSGNVREWCWDWYGDDVVRGADPRGPRGGPSRVWKGGGWIGADFCCEPRFRAGHDPNGFGPDQGFRVCRSK